MADSQQTQVAAADASSEAVANRAGMVVSSEKRVDLAHRLRPCCGNASWEAMRGPQAAPRPRRRASERRRCAPVSALCVAPSLLCVADCVAAVGLLFQAEGECHKQRQRGEPTGTQRCATLAFAHNPTGACRPSRGRRCLTAQRLPSPAAWQRCVLLGLFRCRLKLPHRQPNVSAQLSLSVRGRCRPRGACARTCPTSRSTTA